MSFADLLKLPVRDLAAPDGCHLFLWSGAPFFAQSIELIAAYGFKYSTRAFVWIKLRRGLESGHWPIEQRDLHTSLGLTTRKGAEDVLLGRRGNCRRIAKDVREGILAPVREHSRKPDE